MLMRKNNATKTLVLKGILSTLLVTLRSVSFRFSWLSIFKALLNIASRRAISEVYNFYIVLHLSYFNFIGKREKD